MVRANDASLELADPASLTSSGRTAVDPKPSQDGAPAVKPEETGEEAGPQVQPMSLAGSGHGKREQVTKAGESRDAKRDLAASISTPVTASVAVTTKSGRASKPSTPAMATFAEAATARSRPSRNVDGAGNGVKRSHKKGGSVSVAAAVAFAAQQAAAAADGRRGVPETEDDGDADADELRYCYCNGVSYGEMVACDDKDCPREWFHLGCVGLKVAPKGNGSLQQISPPSPSLPLTPQSQMVLRRLQETTESSRQETHPLNWVATGCRVSMLPGPQRSSQHASNLFIAVVVFGRQSSARSCVGAQCALRSPTSTWETSQQWPVAALWATARKYVCRVVTEHVSRISYLDGALQYVPS